MEKLLKLLNAMPASERFTFCLRCGTTEGYLRKAISTKQLLGETLCILIEAETRGVIRIHELRPALAETLHYARYERMEA